MTTTPENHPLGIDQSIEYWDQRHRRLVDSFAGGDLSYDDMGNVAFNALRIGHLLDLVGTFAEPGAPLRMLDAGCGTGWVTRALASFGHEVDGIDSSAQAVTACSEQARADGRDHYALSRLDEWGPPYLYDAVVSVDVFFHIMEDSVWSASVVNLASLVRLGGRLVLADHDLVADHVWSHYQMSRARKRYVDLLAAEGFVYRRFLPYGFRYNNAGFHVFDRIA
jgi:2-polyprenyl-3-methyl-5-hydroxy-6-metoxy-1,4-benzoquinol methylase